MINTKKIVKLKRKFEIPLEYKYRFSFIYESNFQVDVYFKEDFYLFKAPKSMIYYAFQHMFREYACGYNHILIGSPFYGSFYQELKDNIKSYLKIKE